MIRKWVSILLALVVCLSSIPIAGNVQRIKAGSSWTDVGAPVFAPGDVTADASVIYDSGTSTYKMWYTKGVGAYSGLDSLIAALKASLPPGSTLPSDIKSLNFAQLAANDAPSMKALIHYLAVLDTTAIENLTTSLKPTIGFATSSDGVNWQSQSSTGLDSLAAWEKNGDSSPSVIFNSSTGNYEMWYVGRSISSASIRQLMQDLDSLPTATLTTLMTDLVNKNISKLMSDLGAIQNAQGTDYFTVLLGDVVGLLSTTTSSVGYASSPDGANWTKGQTNPVLQADSGTSDQFGTDSPAVIRKTNGSYEMWYSGYSLDIMAASNIANAHSFADVDNTLASAINIAILHATSENGATWTKDANPALTKGAGPTDWDRYGVAAPAVVQNGTGYELWYTGVNLSLTNLTDIFSGGGLQNTVTAGTNVGIGHAAFDGAWHKDSLPLISKGTGAAWNNLGVGFPSVVKMGPNYRLWYTGVGSASLMTLLADLADGKGIGLALSQSNTKASIGLATSIAGPSVTGISPAFGTTAGGTAVTITGANFFSGATVSIGGNPATSVVFVSPTSITAVTPAGTAGAKDVTVINPDTQQGTLPGGFTYNVTVASTTGAGNVSFAPSAGTITGLIAVAENTLPVTGKPNVSFPFGFFSFNITGLANGQTVTVNVIMPSPVPAGTQYWKYQNAWTRIQAPNFAFAGNVITLTLTDGGIGDADGIANGTIVDPGGPAIGPAPTVSGISPASGTTAGGTSVTITGTNFVSGATVSIGGNPATSVVFGSATSITAVTPAGTAGAKDVTVINPDTQQGTLAGGFTFVAGANVTISVSLQGGGRLESGWAVPLTVKFFSPGANVLTDTPVKTYTGTTNYSGGTAQLTCAAVPSGNYDIAVVSEHTLLSVRRNVPVTLSSVNVSLGTLLEGDANNEGIVDILDFGILSGAYNKSSGNSGYDARADFDRSGGVDILDFGVLSGNYKKLSPVEVQ